MKAMADPRNNRKINYNESPPQERLGSNLVFIKNNKKPDWKLVKDHLKKEGRITKELFLKIIKLINEILKLEGNMISVKDPINVVGDIHGQYYDLLKLFELGGDPENSKYLFLGDFVDRGNFSTEVLILIFCIKLNYPDTLIFLRGNHECRQMTNFFNFKNEVLYKYDLDVYDEIMECFDLFPISCLINGKFLALHGGISPELKNIEDINKIDRKREPPKSGILCDVLWSDPVDSETGKQENLFDYNESRGCSYLYGADAVYKFLKKNDLLSVIRAHEAQIEGFKMYNWKAKSFPLVITIFSAPNYCDTYNNKAAIIKFENNTINIQQFNYSNHPYVLPNFMDIFSWSIPFVSEKVTEMLLEMIKYTETIEEKENKTAPSNNVQVDKEVIRKKIKFISKMVKMQGILRQNREKIIEIKMINGNKLPKGILLEGSEAIQAFNTAKNNDKSNEKMPLNYN